MIDSYLSLNPNATYSYADYLQWRIEGVVEMVKGKILQMSPAPDWSHQSSSGNLHRDIASHLRNKKCKVVSAPFDVRLLDKQKSTADKDIFTVVQPDICVICDPQKIDRRGCLGAPDMIIEILSPSTAEKDLKIKYKLYEENGVKEYWIVQPHEHTVLVFDLDETEKYVLRGIYTRSDRIQLRVLSDLWIVLEDIFTEEDW
jgi:Uma2 family endonuclease